MWEGKFCSVLSLSLQISDKRLLQKNHFKIIYNSMHIFLCLLKLLIICLCKPFNCDYINNFIIRMILISDGRGYVLFDGSHPDVSRNYQNRVVSFKHTLQFKNRASYI
jgi:hypothetical protein